MAWLIDRVVAPAMRSIGELWNHAAEGIYVEHRATDICSQALQRLRGFAPPADGQPAAVGGAPEDDPYTLPSLMAASVLASEGWAETNLGGRTPVASLARAAANGNARLVWVACSTQGGATQLAPMLQALTRQLREAGSDAGVIAGGPALAGINAPTVAGVTYAGSMAELAAFARGLRTARGLPAGPAD